MLFSPLSRRALILSVCAWLWLGAGCDTPGSDPGLADVIEADDVPAIPGADVPDSAGGDAPEPDTADVDEVCRPGAVPALLGTMVAFDFENDPGMFTAPYPNDLFRGAAGFITLPGFLNPRQNTLINEYLALAESTVDGFSPNAPVYFRFDAALDVATLPVGPAASLADDSAIVLVNVDERSPEFGERTPVDWVFVEEAGRLQPDMLLAVAPMSGFPLRPNTRYAALVTGAARDADGRPLGRPEALARVLSGCDDGSLGSVFAPLLDMVRAGHAIPDDIRAATVFTTGAPSHELLLLRDYVAAEYPTGELRGGIIECTVARNPYNARIWWFEGRYRAPNFQRGQAPYAEEGGGIVFDEVSGRPVVQRMEELNFSLFVPDGAVPEEGWPIVMISHGTGGDYTSGPRSTIRRTLQDVGLAGIGIDQPLHGERGGFLADALLELFSFNFLNPEAARSNFRQSAVDTFALTALLRSGLFEIDRRHCDDWPGEEDYDGPERIRFDPQRIYFHGHSQGGLTGSMAAAMEPDVGAWVLSGAGAKMTLTIMERTDPDLLGLIEMMIGVPAGELHTHHPLLMLIQTLVDITDPINYAPMWLRYPRDGRARHVMATTGLLDPYTPRSTAEAMAVAAGLPLIEPVAAAVPGLDLLGLIPFARPAVQTVQGPDEEWATAGFCQYPDAGHFPIFYDQDAVKLYQEFLRTAAYEGVPVLGYSESH